jgi:hypothetical protein
MAQAKTIAPSVAHFRKAAVVAGMAIMEMKFS